MPTGWLPPAVAAGHWAVLRIGGACAKRGVRVNNRQKRWRLEASRSDAGGVRITAARGPWLQQPFIQPRRHVTVRAARRENGRKTGAAVRLAASFPRFRVVCARLALALEQLACPIQERNNTVRYHLFSVVAVTAAAIVPVRLAAQGVFTPLGTSGTYLTGISQDGTIAVGTIGSPGEIFRWTASTGVVGIGGWADVARISRDGKTIVAEADNGHGQSEAAIWLGNKQWRTLGSFGGFGDGANNSVSSAYGISADGSVVVGLSRTTSGKTHAFLWDTANGMVDMGSLQGQSSRANAISGDGTVVVGWDDNSPDVPQYAPPRRAAIWWQGLERLLHPFGWIGEATATNISGTIIVGKGTPASMASLGHGYIWTALGQVEDLGALPRGFTPSQQEEEDRSVALAVSDDGSIVVGASGYKPPTDAFIWTPETKMVKLSDYLKRIGIKGLVGWTLVSANSISPDGTIIAGTGIGPLGQVQGWIATLR